MKFRIISQFTLLFVLFFAQACGQKAKSTSLKNRPIELFYAISLQIDVPFELYLNDIPLAKEYAMSRKIMGIDINPYLLSNGSHSLKARFLAPTNGSKETVSNNDLKTSFLKLVSYEKQTEPDMGRVKNYKVLQELPLAIPDIEIPMVEQEWGIDITDLPYELEGWRNSQDLRLMDSKELEKKVVGFYENLIELLDKGEVDTYMNMLSKFYDETDTVEYLSKMDSQQEKDEIRQELINDSKGYMQPLTNYSLFIYANGRLVTLERNDIKNSGEPALRTKKPNGEEVFYYTYLHLPNGSNEFEIIR
ncbi:hypothetical protein [uncultured Zobellia sp.]|uniref:hypothetical protein n=1 Tax=uncultured Zobellia sp. TaxID=255433 RepID=UPI0025917BEE|nr:hypothetical protein [uncultured Zobellia sp.]